MDEEEEDLIEKEIEAELSKISISSSETDDPETELSAESSSDSEPISDELPESVHRYLNFVRSRSQNAERLVLQNLENDKLNDIPCVVPNSASDCLAELASEYNEDPEEFKKRVLSEIEDEELETSATPDKDTDSNNNGDLSASEAADVCFLTDDGDPVISFSFREVEERCKQEYKLWVEKQKECEHEKMKMLKAKREMEETQAQEENKRRQLRQEELDAERMKIELFHAQQQALLEEELLKEEEAWEEQLRQHKELIKTLHIQIEEETQAFEEQQARERQRLAEQQNMAAVKIQAQFRALMVRKEYAPVLREWRVELKRQQELQEVMEREQKEKEERLKRRALELKEQQERERKSREEKERQELAGRMKRQEEYEKKKEMVRLLRQEQLMLEELKREEGKSKLNLNLESENMDQEITLAKEEQEIEKGEEEGDETKSLHNKIESENTDEDIANKGMELEKMEQEKDQTGNKQRKMRSENKDNCSANSRKEEVIKQVKEQEMESAAVKPRMILGKEQAQKVKCEEEKQDEKCHGTMREKLQCKNGGNENGKLISEKEDVFLNVKHSETSVENELSCAENHCSTTGDTPKTRNTQVLGIDTISVLNHESSIYNDNNNMDAHLDSGDAGRAEKNYALKNIKFAVREIHEETSDHLTNDENVIKCSELPPMLSDSLEEKRLAWMKACKSWSKIHRENQRKKVVDKSRPRKCSASMMPPLSAATIIQAGPWNAMEQVTTVTFQDLPGCSLATLSQCSKLQFLSLRRCGLLALDGLSNCKDLKYIDVEENNIQVINCENLENLCILILNKNNISSLHGLYGCSNLWNLELSYNKITRIGGLESLKNLQQLVMDHNQLISTKGLSDTPTLVYIDCSFNRLTCVEGIENCGLLQILKLQGNNLNELPSLDNHVLLRELYLEDNSISDLDKLSMYWLPLLRILSLSENSLTQLAPLFSFVSLEKLDLGNNCLSELQSIIPWLNGCHHLRELSLLGNPLLQEENWRCYLVRLLPSLQILNGENVHCDAEVQGEKIRKNAEPGSYAQLCSFCQAQIQEIDIVSKKATMGLENEFSVDSAQLQISYFKKLIKLSIEHRYAHEYGVLSATKGEEPERQTHHLDQEAINIIEKNNFFIAGAKENIQFLLHTPERWIPSSHTPVNSFVVPAVQMNKEYKQQKSNQYSFNHNEEGKDSNVLISPKKNKISKKVMASNGGNCLQHFDSSQNLAATVLQSCWRGYRVRKGINLWTRLHLSATVIQSFWRRYCVQKTRIGCNKGHNDMDKHKAATTIQAFWKGFHLRKKLASALAAVKTDEVEDDYSEVNVDDFMFDEAVIEKEWPALDSAHFLSQTALFSDQFPSPKFNEPVRHEDNSHHLKRPLHKTWQIRERSKSFMSENGQISSRSGKSSLSWHSDFKNPQSPKRSEKEEEISKEWGFKDLYTAQLMLKRAQKMKAKKPKSKKHDPAVRLAFKNNENKHPSMKPPKKAQAEKPSFFEDKEEEWTYMDSAVGKMEKSKERTYQWLHTQVWDYEETSPRNEKCKHFLPEIDPEVLKGGRVQLVTSPVKREDTDLELVSMTSGSPLTHTKEKNNQPRRHSAGSSKKDAPAPEKSHLGPSLKERISFRDHPVQLSGGWGSGKKKAKALK